VIDNFVHFELRQVKQWSIPLRKCVKTMQAHEGFVRGMSVTPDSEMLITVGDDKNIRFWPTAVSECPDDADSTIAKHSIISKVLT